MNEPFHLIDNIAISTRLLANSLLGFSLHKDCVEEAQELMHYSAARLIGQRKAIQFLTTGIIVTNAAWVMHFLGWF